MEEEKYQEAGEPQDIASKLIEELKEFEHLKAAKVYYLFARKLGRRNGKSVYGKASLANPKINYLTGGCDFLIEIDHDLYHDLNEMQREALVYHELSHCGRKEMKKKKKKDGTEIPTLDSPPTGDDTPEFKWCIIPHDLEEFGAVVRRYGLIFPDQQEFISDANEGVTNVLKERANAVMDVLEAAGATAEFKLL